MGYGDDSSWEEKAGLYIAGYEKMKEAAAGRINILFGAEIRFDEQAAAAHFCYRDAAGLWREVWFEDLRSVKARMALAAAYGLGGLSYWTAESLTRPVLLAQSERFSPLKLI